MSDMNKLIKGIGNKNKNVVNREEHHLNKEEVLKNYSFNFDADEDTIDYLKEQTFKLHKANNNFHTELGKILTETQEKLSKSGYGCFVEWYKNLGFKNDTVYRYISRYKLISSFAQSERQIVETIESMPLSLSYEIAKETCPAEMREKVLSGQIKNKVEFVQALKSVKEESKNHSESESKNNSSTLEKFQEVEEAEIIEKRTLEGVNKSIRKIKTRINEIDLIAVEKDGLLESEIKELADIVERLNRIGIR